MTESERPLDISVYRVFDGVSITFINAHAARYYKEGRSGRYLEILHAREGRTEWESSGSCCFLSSGDISVAGRDDDSFALDFQLKHFHGLSILFDLDKAPSCFSCILEDARVSPEEIMQKYSPEGIPFIARSDKHIAHIFSEIYDMDEEYRAAYFRVKVLELLLFLASCRFPEEPESFLPKAQAENARSVASYLTEHLSEHVTIAELSRIFASSPTSLKSSFRKVYGISVYRFARKARMEAAAEKLRSSDRTITDIALSYGYENSSKFSAAFLSEIGMSPSQYRKSIQSAKLSF